MNKRSFFFTAIILSSQLLSQLLASSINVEIQYQEALSSNKVREAKSLTLPDAFTDEFCVSHPGMHKSLFAIKLSNLIKSSLNHYHSDRDLYSRPYPLYEPCHEPAEPTTARPCPVPPPRYWEQIRKEHAQRLLHNIERLQATASCAFVSDPDIAESLLLAQKLADNMLNDEIGPVFESFGSNNYAPMMKMDSCHMMAAAPASLHLTSGGVQDYSHFKKQLQDGFVPAADAFIEEGFLSSFDLSLQNDGSDQLISLHPAYAYDKETKKLLVQVGMSSNVTPESFKRRSVNLAFVIDISGSMAATDNTERSRLEWAKDAVHKAIANLDENDTVSIVLFDSVSQVILQPTPVLDKAAILHKLQKVQPGNSTNLDAGLRDGFVLASKAFNEQCENRVLLFSDAGLNTGVTDTSSILRLVSDYAAENIGLTAIGVGENFHHDFIHKITMSKGGNALFVHTGQDLVKFFNNFDYLVTPVAYNLKVSSTLVDMPTHAKLVKTYGVPMLKNEPVQELINVRTLFFSEGGGGAIILEYDL